MALDRVRAGFAGADPDGLVDVRYKYLAIADAAGLGRAPDRLDRGTEILVRDHDLDFHLRQEVDDIFGAPIKLGMALLATEALRFQDSYALDSRLLQRLLHFIELERLDDRLDLFHFFETPHRPRCAADRFCPFLGGGKPAPRARGSIASDRGSRHRAPVKGSALGRTLGRRPVNRQSGELSGGRSDRRSPFARAKDPPRCEPGLCDHRSPRLGDCDQMSEHTRMAPSHWPLRRANGAVFVAIPVLHEDRADKVWAQLPGQIAAGQPFAFEVAAYLRTLCVNRAAAADPAIVAQRARRLVEMCDLQRRAAHRAGPAGFSQRRGHHFLLALRPRLTNR